MFACAAPDRVPVAKSAPMSCLCCGPAMARFHARMTAGRPRRQSAAAGPTASPFRAGARGSTGLAQKTHPSAPIAFENLRLFDGKADFLRDGLRVIVDGQKIASVEPAEKPLAPNMETIDCGGRVLIPGMIDAHYHVMMASLPLNDLMTADIGFINLSAAAEAERVLMRGFTSIRDMAGPCFGLKRAIDSGLVPGPRIWPSGAMISQTAGHGDYRTPHEIPSPRAAALSHSEVFGVGAIADAFPRFCGALASN